ncbi:MAG: tetratricopeptide repeat protein, partial [Spirulinaceae cyanobacterium]
MNQLAATLERYQKAIEKLEQSKSVLGAEEVLAILNARDALQIALKAENQPTTSKLNRTIQLDEKLRQNATAIVKTIKPEKLAQWRESIHPAPEAWWWKLETIVPPHPWDRLDSLWKILTLASWTANISLLASLATRFFSGGVGFLGAAAVTLPSLIALLQASSELTKTGQEGFDNLLTKFGVAPHWREEVKLVSTLAVSGLIATLWFSLPAFSNFYNRSGLKNYDAGKLGSAEQDWQKATSLNADNVDAYYNLGNLYEELQQFEQAKKNYQVALGGDIPDAFNNLGR